jgi:hypothetical protein
MATLLSTVITQARNTLNEASANFWSDAELLVHATDACKDLWKAIIDLDQGHFQTVDDTNVSLAVATATLTGVPTDTFRVELIELRNQTTTNTLQNVSFSPCKIKHPRFSSARSLGTVDPNGQEFLFSIRSAGSPVAAPSIDIAPLSSTAVPLRFVYVPTLGTLTAASANPIPGDSDHAVYAWTVAHALAKEREDRKPHPDFIAFYATDKRNLLVALTPRQTQEPDIAEALFESYW